MVTTDEDRVLRGDFKKIRRLRSSNNSISDRDSRSLYSIRSLTFSQCRNVRTGCVRTWKFGVND